MKKGQKIEKIRPVSTPKPSDDINAIKKQLLSNELEDVEIVSVGENRGQLFIRLPTRMTNRMGLTATDKIRITLTGSEEKVRMYLEPVRANDP